jgi:hypothetical protein
MSYDDTPTIDTQRAVQIEEWTAAVVVYPDGEEMLWLLSPNSDGTPGCCCADCAPHEQVRQVEWS